MYINIFSPKYAQYSLKYVWIQNMDFIPNELRILPSQLFILILFVLIWSDAQNMQRLTQPTWMPQQYTCYWLMPFKLHNPRDIAFQSTCLFNNIFLPENHTLKALHKVTVYLVLCTFKFFPQANIPLSLKFLLFSLLTCSSNDCTFVQVHVVQRLFRSQLQSQKCSVFRSVTVTK